MGLLNRMRNSGEISSAMLLNGEHFGGVISFLKLFGNMEFLYYKAFIGRGRGIFLAFQMR